jgi:hypothetical protein
MCALSFAAGGPRRALRAPRAGPLGVWGPSCGVRLVAIFRRFPPPFACAPRVQSAAWRANFTRGRMLDSRGGARGDESNRGHGGEVWGIRRRGESKELKDSRPPIFRATDCSPTSHVARARPRPSAGGRGVSEHCHRQGGVTHGRALGVCIPVSFPLSTFSMRTERRYVCGAGEGVIGPSIQRKSIPIRRHLLLLASNTLLFTHARAPRERGRGGRVGVARRRSTTPAPPRAPTHLACDSVRRRPYRPQRGEGARGRRVKWGSSQ